MVVAPLLNKGITLAVLSEFGNIPKFIDLFTNWDKIGDIIWRIHLRALAGYDDMWHALFFKLDMILSIWLGVTSRNRIEFDIDWKSWGSSSVDWKESEISRPIDAKKLFSLSEISWFSLYSMSLDIRDLIELFFLQWFGLRNPLIKF